MEDCAFCEIVAGRLPCSVIAESPMALAFCDIRQPHAQDDGLHVLIVPKHHVETLDGLDPADGAALISLAIDVAKAMRREFSDEGLSLWQSNGKAAFQEVPHVHLHLLTRRQDDALLKIYPDEVPEPATRAQLDAAAMRLMAAIRSCPALESSPQSNPPPLERSPPKVARP